MMGDFRVLLLLAIPLDDRIVILFSLGCQARKHGHGCHTNITQTCQNGKFKKYRGQYIDDMGRKILYVCMNEQLLF